MVEKELVTEEKRILEILLASKLHEYVVGIHSEQLGSELCLTQVEDIIIPEGQTPIVILKGYDISGHFLDRNKINLESITSVYPFSSKFENPFIPKPDDETKSMLA